MKQENRVWVDPKTLKTDGQNPNKITKSMKESLKANILKFGWNMPIITDMDLMVADGEQKLSVALEENWSLVPILKKSLSVSERKVVRQSMNKITGSHDPELDSAEFKRILESFEKEDLSTLTGISEQEILNSIEQTDKDTAESVKRVAHMIFKCPKCQHKFRKEEGLE